MTTITCQEAELQLDLLAAGECDAATRQLIERHLDGCPACAASFCESQRLQGMLDLQLNVAGPALLRARIEREERLRPRFLPFARRAAAIAAVLLLTASFMWTAWQWQAGGEPSLQLAVGMSRGDGVEIVPGMPAMVRVKPETLHMQAGADPMTITLPAQQFGESFRKKLREAERGDKLPLPTAVPLTLAFKNTGKATLEVRLGDAVSALALDIEGAGVVRVPAPGAAVPAFFDPQTLKVRPGETRMIRIERLIAGTPGQLEYVYLTEPGAFKLTARMRLIVGGKTLVLRSEPMHLELRQAAAASLK